MKHSKASIFIRNALFCVQKVRSISAENEQNDPGLYRVQQFLEPKIFDDRYLLSPLLKIVDRLDNGGRIEPIEFYNIMTIIDRWAQSVEAEYVIQAENLNGFPKPDIQWMRGWDAE